MNGNATSRIKTVAFRQLLSRCMQDHVMVFLKYSSNDDMLRVGQRAELVFCHSDLELRNQRLHPVICQFEYVNIDYIECKNWVIEQAVTPHHAVGKQGEIKTVLFLTRLYQYQGANIKTLISSNSIHVWRMIGMGGSSRNGVLMPTGFYPLKFWGNCMSRKTSPKELFLILAWLFFLDFCYATNVKHKLEIKMHFSDNASMEARYV